MGDMLKRKQARINLSPESEKHLASMVESIGSLSETAILTALVDAGLKACAENGNRLHLPLKFKLSDDFSRINEPDKPQTKAKR